MREQADSIYVLPSEHKEFVAEFKKLLTRYPKAATRFGLIDLGSNPKRDGHAEVECVEVMDITICEIQEPEE